jgi:hypothetical protein
VGPRFIYNEVNPDTENTSLKNIQHREYVDSAEYNSTNRSVHANPESLKDNIVAYRQIPKGAREARREAAMLKEASKPDAVVVEAPDFASEAAASFVEKDLPAGAERGSRQMRTQDLAPIEGAASGGVDNTFRYVLPFGTHLALALTLRTSTWYLPFRSEFGITLRTQTPLTDAEYEASMKGHGKNSAFSIPIEHYTGGYTKEL